MDRPDPFAPDLSSHIVTAMRPIQAGPAGTSEIVYENSDVRVVVSDVGGDLLVLSFSNMLFKANGSDFWGRQFFQKNGYSAIGFVAKGPNWFPAAAMALAAEAVRGTLNKFKTRVSYGNSMGAYAALKFSNLLGADAAIAFSPQFSIDPSVVGGFEKRFTAYFDPARHAGMAIRSEDCAARAYLFYDPFETPDMRHVERIRLAQPDARLFPVAMTGHNSISVFAGSASGRLLLQSCVDDDGAPLRDFIARERRRNPSRASYLAERLVVRHPVWAHRVLAAAEKTAPAREFARSCLQMAQAHSDLGRVPEMTFCANKAAAVVETLPPEDRRQHQLNAVLHAAAGYLVRGGDFEGAERASRASVLGAPTSVGCLRRLMRIELFLGRTSEATEIVRHLLHLDPELLETLKKDLQNRHGQPLLENLPGIFQSVQEAGAYAPGPWLSGLLSLAPAPAKKPGAVAPEHKPLLEIPASAPQSAPTLMICGTSNSLLKNGYVHGMYESGRFRDIKNYSIGGSSSIFLSRVALEFDTRGFDFAIFDFAPNEDTFYRRGLSSEAEIENRMLDFISRHMSTETIPVMVVHPMIIGFGEDRTTYLSLLEICRRNGVIVFDGYKYIKKACRLTGTTHRAYFLDRDHLKREVAYFFGLEIARVLSAIEKNQIQRRDSVVEIPPYHFISVVTPENEARAIARKTSICSARFLDVGENEGPTIKLNQRMTLVGAGVNVTQSSGMLVALSGPDRTGVAVTHEHRYRPDEKDNVKSLVYMIRPMPELEGDAFHFRASRREGEDGVVELAGAVFRGPLEKRRIARAVLPRGLSDVDLEIGEEFLAYINGVIKKSRAALSETGPAPADASRDEIERRCALAERHIRGCDLFEAELTLRGLSPEGGAIPSVSRVFAQFQMARHDFAAAERTLREALDVSPDDLPLRRTLFRLHVGQGNFAGSLEALKGVDWSELTSDELHSLGRSALKEKNYKLAVDAIDACVARGAPSSRNYAVLSTALFAMNAFERVVDTCKKLLEIEPNRASAMMECGRALKKFGRTDEAIPLFEKWRALRPDDLRSHRELGVALAQSGRLDEAREIFERGVALHPGSRELRAELERAQAQPGDGRAEPPVGAGDSPVGAGEPPEAEPTREDPSPEGGAIPTEPRLLAEFQMERRDFDAAERTLRAALDASPDDLSLKRTLFRLHVDQGKFAQSLEALKGVDWNELTADELHHLGRSALKARKHKLAVDAIDACIARGAPSARNYAILSSALFTLNAFERVVDTCAKLLEIEPDRASAMMECGRALKRLGRTEEAIPLFEKWCALCPEDIRSHLELGNALVHLRRADEAREIFERGVARHPDSHELLFELGRAQARLGDRRAAFENFGHALQRDPRHLKAGLEYVRQAMTMRKFEIAKSAAETLIAAHPEHSEVLFEFGRMSLETAAPERARECFLKALELKPNLHQCHYRLAQLALRERNIDEAVERYSAALAIDPDRISYRIDRARALLALDRLEDAAKDARHALEFEPRNPKALQIVKLVDGLFGENSDPTVAVAFFHPGAEAAAFDARLKHVAPPHRAFAPGAGENRLAAPAADALAALFSAGDAGWLGVIEDADRAEAALRLLADGKALSAQLKHVGPSVGLVEIGPQGAPGVVLYRREFLHFVFDAAPILNSPYMDLLAAHRDKIRAVHIDPTGKLTRLRPEAKATGPREVFLISRHGIELYGGGEQFLRGMSKVYRGLGYAPLIVGMRNDVPQVIYGDRDGERFAEIQPMPADVFALALVHEPAVVHVLSGLGYEVITPLKYLHLHTVYGTHFWRDMYEEIGGYLDIDRHAVPKREYHALIENASVIYSNSHFTAEMKRKHFGFSTPIVYSLTDDVATEPSPPGDYALLVNARPEKGFDLILEVAKRAPKARFLVIASQSPVAQAEEMVAAAGVTNIKVIGRTSKMEETYRGARVVLVPSYAFIETFSRVVIEAHRLGVPVVGSDRGNVPYLLTESGVALPEDADAWAKELTRLFTDDGYHAARRRMALENSQRYAFARQPERIRRILGYCNNRILVAVGAGLGNIVQTSPLLRRISEHFGHSIDVVVKEDFKGCSYLAAGAPWVNMVFPLGRNVLQREYDLVYVTHSFGDLIPSFNSNKTIAARRHYPFGMTQNMHESEFNLFCAEKLLGIPYEKGDAAKYFVASAEKSQLPNGVIALHSGGKGGEWAGGWLNKRWPYYRDLVVELQRRGFKVASFGVKDEYVEGTIDMTGTSLPVTIQNLSRCSYFIGNDSGVMHIADGLGVPLTTIFGPTSVVKNGPLAPTSSVLELKKECAPCQFDEKRFSTCTCISEITLERYLEHILAHMAEIGVLAELQAEAADAAE